MYTSHDRWYGVIRAGRSQEEVQARRKRGRVWRLVATHVSRMNRTLCKSRAARIAKGMSIRMALRREQES